MFIIKHKKIFVSVSALLVLLSLVFFFIFGLGVSIDFKGGALTEVLYKEIRPEQKELDLSLKGLPFGPFVLQPTGEKGLIVKSKDLSEEEHFALLGGLSQNNKYSLVEKGFNSIGPSVGKELTRKAVIAVILVSLAIILFIAFAFRKVSKPVSSWKYGVIAIICLIHDVLIPVGIFTLLGRFLGAEIDTLFVVAILTILGLSVSDTIVIFDRIRENLKEWKTESFAEIVGKSLDQSYMRSIFTSLTVMIVLLSLFFFGPESTKYFALMLTAGMFFGTYSSIFLAAPLLTFVEGRQKK